VVRRACGTSGAIPLPLSAALWGEFAALSTTVTAALKAVAALGVKVTERVAACSGSEGCGAAVGQGERGWICAR